MWRLVATSIVAFAVLASSCFWVIRFFRTVEQYLEPGDNTRVLLNLHPFDQTTSAVEGYPFLLIGYNNMKSRPLMKFDMFGNYGGPYDGVRDNVLEARLLEPNVCSTGSVDAEDIMGDFTDWKAYRTPVEIDNTGGIDAAALDLEMRVIHNVKALATADPASDLAGQMVIFSGAWNDNDDDGVIDTAAFTDITGCASAIFFNFPLFVP